MPIELIVGLGNPPAKYAATRHNVGFMLLDSLMEHQRHSEWRPYGHLGVVAEAAFPPSAAGEGPRLLRCAKPTTYMNESGRMVKDILAQLKLRPSDLLVCYDELALPLGKLRIRSRGSSGGHKGMQSIIDHLGTEDVPRLRLGIGPCPPGVDATGFVLENFRDQELKPLEESFARAREALREAVSSGLESAMNRFNAPEAPAA